MGVLLGRYVWPFKMDTNQSFRELDIMVVENVVLIIIA